MIKMAFLHLRFGIYLISQSLRNYVKNLSIDDYVVGSLNKHWGEYEDTVVQYRRDIKPPSLPIELPLILLMLDNFRNGNDIFYNIEERMSSLEINDIYVTFTWLYKERRMVEKQISDFKLLNYNIIGTHFFKSGLITATIILILIKQRNPDIKIVCGGPYMGMYPGLMDIFYSFKVIDTFVRGPGEESLQTLVNLLVDKKEWPKIIEKHISIRSVPPVSVISDIADPGEVFFKDVGIIQGSRGCRWSKCSFCCSPDNIKYQVVSADDFANIVIDLYKDGIKDFVFVDNMFNHSKDYVLTFYNKLRSNNVIGKINIRKLNIRADIMDDDIALAFKEMNAKVYPGFESFSPRILNLMNKGLTLDDNLNCIKKLKKHNVYYFPFNIIGFPGETEIEFFETLKYLKDYSISIDGDILCFFKLEGGTPIYNNPDKFGISLIDFPVSLTEKFPHLEKEIKSIPMRYIDLNDPDDKQFEHKRRISRLLNKNRNFWNVFLRDKTNNKM